MKQYHEALFLSYRPRCSMQYSTILQNKLDSFNIQDDRSTRRLLARPFKAIPIKCFVSHRSPSREGGSVGRAKKKKKEKKEKKE